MSLTVGLSEGWGFMGRRWHYFRRVEEHGRERLRSFCGSYGWYGDGSDLRPDEGPDDLDCKSCARRLRPEPEEA